MADRVALGNLGSSLWGLRVSVPGQNVVSGNTAVDLANIAFDSIYPVGNWVIYKIYDITVSAGTPDSGAGNTPATQGVTHSFPALSYIPFVLVYRRVSAGTYESERWSSTIYSGPTTYHVGDGVAWQISKSSLQIWNHYTTQQTYRAVIFKIG